MSARRHAHVAVAVLAAVAAGCGGSGSGDTGSPEAQEVVQELESLREGEIVIKGSSPRAYGPYTLEPGGYVFSFEQQADASARIVVALESKPGSRKQPYALLANSEERSGTRRVALSGKLYVHVLSAAAEYELRFTPSGS